MTYPAKTIFIFGIYMTVLGIVLLIIPNLLLGMVGIPNTSGVWIRVVGMLVIFLGVYDMVAGVHDLRPFIIWSIYVRLSVIVFFFSFVALNLAPKSLLLFGLVDLFAALWTWWALKNEN